jgi:hypothetical protein
MVEGDEQVDELDMAGYNNEKRQFVNILNSGDDDEEMKMGFLMKSGGWINHGAVLGVLWV